LWITLSEGGNPGSRQLHDPRFKIKEQFTGSSGVSNARGAASGTTGPQVHVSISAIYGSFGSFTATGAAAASTQA